MKQLVEYIVSNLVNHPEDVIIEEQAGDGEFTLINIQLFSCRVFTGRTAYHSLGSAFFFWIFPSSCSILLA